MEFTEQVIILHVGRFRETDLLVRFLSPSRGLISAFAFGGGRSRRRFPGCLDIFNEVLIKAKASPQGTYLALLEGVLLRGSRRLRSDWTRFGMAANCAKFLQSFGVGPEGADKAHLLMGQMLHLLEEAGPVPVYLPFLFRARVAFDQGYALHCEACVVCGAALASTGAVFSVGEGRLRCPSCASVPAEGRAVRLSPGSVALLAAVRHHSPWDWMGLHLGERDVAECARALDSFVRFHVGLAWERGRFARV
jgi:DNA repair protein RecO (recombination protein O)